MEHDAGYGLHSLDLLYQEFLKRPVLGGSTVYMYFFSNTCSDILRVKFCSCCNVGFVVILLDKRRFQDKAKLR
jgi:hypothetical protein